ncbi:hypothetical protein ABPG77_002924 [Micractinium sp. CCAP 211/92]
MIRQQARVGVSCLTSWVCPPALTGRSKGSTASLQSAEPAPAVDGRRRLHVVYGCMALDGTWRKTGHGQVQASTGSSRPGNFRPGRLWEGAAAAAALEQMLASRVSFSIFKGGMLILRRRAARIGLHHARNSPQRSSLQTQREAGWKQLTPPPLLSALSPALLAFSPPPLPVHCLLPPPLPPGQAPAFVPPHLLPLLLFLPLYCFSGLRLDPLRPCSCLSTSQSQSRNSDAQSTAGRRAGAGLQEGSRSGR